MWYFRGDKLINVDLYCEKNNDNCSFPFLNNDSKHHFCDSSDKTLYPIIKLGEKITYNPEKTINCFSVIVKAQPLLSRDGKSTTALLKQICEDGGIHNHLDYDGVVILSSIMPDRAIAGLTGERYAEMIDVLGVDSYITPDGETYLGETTHSTSEISRIIDQTDEILKLCPKQISIGLVKGCTVEQMMEHIDYLQHRGVTSYCFHAGDYFRGPEYIAKIGLRHASAIRTMVPNLIIYGVGSKRHINSFRFADGFATQSHFIRAFRGYKHNGIKWVRYKKLNVIKDVIKDNLCSINRFVSDLKWQKQLSLLSHTEKYDAQCSNVNIIEQIINDSVNSEVC